MSQLAHDIHRRSRRAQVLCAALFALVAPALLWIGRSTAGPRGQVHPVAVSKTVANVPTRLADAIDLIDTPCTVSPNYTDMPGTSVTFRLGGSTSRPVMVLFGASWYLPNEGVELTVRLLIDGIGLVGSTDVLVAERPSGVSLVFGAHGFNFVSDPLAPGMHTAKIQWHDNGVNFGCVRQRNLIVMHM